MKQFRSTNRAMKRGHLAIKVNPLTKQAYLVRSTNKISNPEHSKEIYKYL